MSFLYRSRVVILRMAHELHQPPSSKVGSSASPYPTMTVKNSVILAEYHRDGA
jgi:hypothetical protein